MFLLYRKSLLIVLFLHKILKMLRFIVFIGIVLALDFYAFQSFRSVTKTPWVIVIYVISTIAIFGNVIYHVVNLERSVSVNTGFYQAFAFFVLFYVPKLFLVSAMFGEDVFRPVSYTHLRAHET